MIILMIMLIRFYGQIHDICIKEQIVTLCQGLQTNQAIPGRMIYVSIHN